MSLTFIILDCDMIMCDCDSDCVVLTAGFDDSLAGSRSQSIGWNGGKSLFETIDLFIWA